MHPILFKIPGLDFPIRSFGVMVVAGFLLGTVIVSRLASRYADDPEQDAPGYAAIPIWVLIGVLIGARLMYVAVEILQGSEVGQSYQDNIFKVFAYWEGGLVMYGGLLGGMIAGLRCARKYGLRPIHALDINLVGAFAGLAVGRIGCLLVGDDYGRRLAEGVDLPFPIAIRVPEQLPEASLFGAENAGQLLYATQVWMSVNAAAIALLGVFLLRRRRYTGQVSLWLLLVYAVTRSTIEHFRGDAVRGLWFDGRVSTSQLISSVIGLICLALLVRNRKRSEPPPRAQASAGS